MVPMPFNKPAVSAFLAAGFIVAVFTAALAQNEPGMAAPGAPSAAPPPPGVEGPAGPPAAVTPPVGSDWPCVQAKVMTLTSAQIWDGPPVEDIKDWHNDQAIADLVPILLSRRLSMEEVETAIEKFANSIPEGPERNDKLTRLFAGVLHETNVVRSKVVNGIETFQQRQRGRSHRLEEQGRELAALQSRAYQDKDAALNDSIAKLQNEYDWNARVFADRQANLPLACEIPVEIEQRAFAVGRAIRNHMTD